MPTYECRPDSGTNTANDTFTSGGSHDFADFSWAVGRFDILVESNGAIVEFRPSGASWGDGDEMILKTGQHSIPLDNRHEGIRIKNRTNGSNADYQFTAFPWDGD